MLIVCGLESVRYLVMSTSKGVLDVQRIGDGCTEVLEQRRPGVESICVKQMLGERWDLSRTGDTRESLVLIVGDFPVLRAPPSPL